MINTQKIHTSTLVQMSLPWYGKRDDRLHGIVDVFVLNEQPELIVPTLSRSVAKTNEDNAQVHHFCSDISAMLPNCPKKARYSDFSAR